MGDGHGQVTVPLIEELHRLGDDITRNRRVPSRRDSLSAKRRRLGKGKACGRDRRFLHRDGRSEEVLLSGPTETLPVVPKDGVLIDNVEPQSAIAVAGVDRDGVCIA
ncbi:MAG: hypothetical protein A2289_14670 [Deltaproteobacteria bacterium RIFOXYA12_FULL_58_15]|nr:MAG: hypothetical protein A2289_14670 [Deltaproteobacteria bacterium RIFOXYA12_FULL_58_15]